MKYKLVVVVRDDLDLSCGKIAVQVAHASVECAIRAIKNSKKIFDEWYREGQRKIVVMVKDMDDLLFLKDKAEKFKLITCLIRDAGLTEVPPGTVTCLGIGPGDEQTINRVTGNLPLL